MEQDILKSAWLNMAAAPKNHAEIRHMIRESSHPALKRIRKQLIIEAIAFTLFLFVYYNFFDGDRRPFYVNALLVAGLLFLIIHNIAGYILTKNPSKGDNVKQTLEDFISKMKTYAIVSIVIRILSNGFLLFFFTWVIMFNTKKVLILAAIIIVLIVQITFLFRIWMKRIRHIKDIIDDFDQTQTNYHNR